jgi:hypothetical protein
MISTDAHAAAATEQNNSQESNIVTKVKNTIKQARANIIPLLIGGAAAMLLHNHLPILKRTCYHSRYRVLLQIHMLCSILVTNHSLAQNHCQFHKTSLQSLYWR